MASIADTGHSAGARWTLTALLRRLAPAPRARVVLVQESDVAAVAPVIEARRRHYYPPQRDRFIERSAMAREMYRL
jgi:hypothetical protein